MINEQCTDTKDEGKFRFYIKTKQHERFIT